MISGHMATAVIEPYYMAYVKFGFEKTLSNNRDIVSQNDEKLIRNFIDDKIAMDGIGIARQTQIGVLLVYWKRYIKTPYNQLNYEDFKNGVGAFRNARKENGEPYKQNHQRNMIATLKSFVNWLIDENIIAPIDHKKMKRIKPPQMDTDTNKSSDLFTPDEINRMVAACHNSRDRAFIMTIYETGARPGEIARLTWSDLVFSKESVEATITDKKTKKHRTAYIIAGANYLAQYRNDKGNINPDDLVFKANGDKPLTPSNAYKIIYNAKNEAGITKRVQLKLYRKSRISNMMKEGYNDGAIREQIWGNQGTQMFKVYAKYSKEDTKKAMMEKAGIVTDEQKQEAETKPRKCHVCGRVNGPNDKWCPECRSPLTEDGMGKVKDAREDAKELLKKLLSLNLKPEEYGEILKNF